MDALIRRMHDSDMPLPSLNAMGLVELPLEGSLELDSSTASTGSSSVDAAIKASSAHSARDTFWSEQSLAAAESASNGGGRPVRAPRHVAWWLSVRLCACA